MKKTYCPFFVKEAADLSELICTNAVIKFPDLKSRREFVYTLCGSLGGFCGCPIYKFLENREERLK